MNTHDNLHNSHAHRPDMTEALLKRTQNYRSSVIAVKREAKLESQIMFSLRNKIIFKLSCSGKESRFL